MHQAHVGSVNLHIQKDTEEDNCFYLQRKELEVFLILLPDPYYTML